MSEKEHEQNDTSQDNSEAEVELGQDVAEPDVIAEMQNQAPEVIDHPKELKENSDLMQPLALDENSLIVCGIGASAGGLEALRLLINHLPVDSPVAYVVAQHLSPQHRSMLVSLLGRETSMNVLEAHEAQKVYANHIYIIPPNSDVSIHNGVLHLREPISSIGPKPSVDYFFTSLAEDKGEKAVGIILSGTGTDGAHGIRAIKAQGGFVYAQDESTAKYNGMPRAAIDTGCVDAVLAPQQIGPALVNILKYPHTRNIITKPSKSMGSMERLFRILLERTNCDFSDYKINTLQRRIERRMVAQRIGVLEDYVQYLESSPKEATLLCKDILISVTSFFRDDQPFKVLGKYIEMILQTKKSGDPIRIWVPGCATGEEVYSLAILLSEILGNKIRHYNIQIFGTDIDTDATLRARKGIYPETSLADLDKDLVDKYFLRNGNSFQVVKSIKEIVVFARQDLVKDPPFSKLDLISCRNLLIYFENQLQKRIIPLFHYVLNNHGYLMLGKSESIGLYSDLFVPVDKRWKIYKRVGSFRQPPLEVNSRISASRNTSTPSFRSQVNQPSLEEVLLKTMNRYYAPSCVVVDEQLNMLHIFGDVRKFLSYSSGEVVRNILKSINSEFANELRAMMHKASKERIIAQGKPVKINDEDEIKVVRLVVHPIEQFEDTAVYAICFEEIPLEKTSIRSAEPGEIDDAKQQTINELEQDLISTREHLQTVIEELETANEELQSLNEELQASNEELQSSNEELETSNEELQSTNEELLTVNEELQIKSGELASAYSDLENIQRSIGFALVVIDRDLRVMRFTEPATEIFGLLNTDLGHVLTSVPCNIDLPNIRQALHNTIEHGQIYEEEIHANEKYYLWRIFPYYTESKEIVGAVVTFADRSSYREVEKQLRLETEHFKQAQEVANIATWAWDSDSDQFLVSEQITRLFHMEGPFHGSFPEFIQLMHPEDRETVRQHIMNSLKSQQDFRFEHRVVAPDDSEHWYYQTGKVICHEKTKSPRVIGVVVNQDSIHLLKQAQTEMKKEQQRAQDAEKDQETLKESIRVHEKIEKRLQEQLDYSHLLNNRLNLINQINSLIKTSNNLESLCQSTCKLMVQMGQYELVWITLNENAGAVRDPAAFFSNTSDIKYPYSRYVEDAMKHHPNASVLEYPIALRNLTLGALHVFHMQKDLAEKSEYELVCQVGDLLAMGINFVNNCMSCQHTFISLA